MASLEPRQTECGFQRCLALVEVAQGGVVSTPPLCKFVLPFLPFPSLPYRKACCRSDLPPALNISISSRWVSELYRRRLGITEELRSNQNQSLSVSYAAGTVPNWLTCISVSFKVSFEVRSNFQQPVELSDEGINEPVLVLYNLKPSFRHQKASTKPVSGRACISDSTYRAA